MNSPTTPDLKLCPFCGGEASFGKITVNSRKVFHSVNCKHCMAKVAGLHGYDTKAEAAEAWNRRAEDDHVLQKIVLEQSREIRRLKATQDGYEKATVDALSAVTVSAIMTAMQRAPK